MKHHSFTTVTHWDLPRLVLFVWFFCGSCLDLTPPPIYVSFEQAVLFDMQLHDLQGRTFSNRMVNSLSGWRSDLLRWTSDRSWFLNVHIIPGDFHNANNSLNTNTNRNCAVVIMQFRRNILLELWKHYSFSRVEGIFSSNIVIPWWANWLEYRRSIMSCLMQFVAHGWNTTSEMSWGFRMAESHSKQLLLSMLICI